MCSECLTAYWIVPPTSHGPIGFGVTARSLDDALDIIRSFGYELPDDPTALKITADVKVTDLQHDYVRQHMGPIIVRGLWYPFRHVGMSSG